MYLSRLTLDPRSREARRDAASNYELHSTLERVFHRAPEDQSREYLFRRDYSPRACAHQVLILSRTLPDFSTLPQGYELKVEGPNEFNPQLAPGQRLNFRLLANPTRKEKRDERKNKPRAPILDVEAQKQWLQRKLTEAGADVLDVRIETQPTLNTYKRGEKARREKTQTFVPVLFEGVLQVNSPEALKEHLAKGIGSAKGYGFGLLSLAPA